MSSEFKQCPNGHYYQGDHCPYCKTSGSNAGSATSAKTAIYGGLGNPQSSTKTVSGIGGAPQATVGGGETIINNAAVHNQGGASSQMNRTSSPSNSTVFGDEYDMGGVPDGRAGVEGYRETRKLVGWLVSYTLDAMGVDYKLYEGRNIIGRDVECNISVNDNMVSSKHAVILFRAGKYSITDSQSSHGTFVNDSDIELEPYYLQDGDVIRMGKTVFKFRSSL